MSPEQLERLLEILSSSNQKDIFDWLLGFIQVAFLGVGLWYTIETRRLRKQTRLQYELQRKQLLYSKYPQIVLNICHSMSQGIFYHSDICVEVEKTLKRRNKNDPEFRFDTEQLKEQGCFVAEVKNASEFTIYDVTTVMYDHENHNFIHGIDWLYDIQPNEATRTVIYGEPVSRKTASLSISRLLKMPSTAVSKALETQSSSFIVTFYRNNESSVFFSHISFIGKDPVSVLSFRKGVLKSPYYPEGIPFEIS